MASQPETAPPDTIEPQSPSEVPDGPDPVEHPFTEPPELEPTSPDYDEPDPGRPEILPPPD